MRHKSKTDKMLSEIQKNIRDELPRPNSERNQDIKRRLEEYEFVDYDDGDDLELSMQPKEISRHDLQLFYKQSAKQQSSQPISSPASILKKRDSIKVESEQQLIKTDSPRLKAQIQQSSSNKLSQDSVHKAAVNSAREEWQKRHQNRQDQASANINSYSDIKDNQGDSERYIIKKADQSPDHRSSSRKSLRDDIVNDSMKRKLKKLQIKEVFTNLYFE